MNKFSYDSSHYTNFRPQYPNALFEYLKTLINDNDLVLECGAGSGQGTIGLSSYFKSIIATDLSFELLLQAPNLPNVQYIQSSAEHLPICSNSMSLVCVAQAMHWFSLDHFYAEIKRILKPNGIIAAWCYNQAVIEPAVDCVISEVYLKITNSKNLSPERQYVYDHYQTIPFPFKRILTPTFNIKMDWNLMHLLGYMNTWPGILEYQKKFNVNVLSQAEEKLISAWGNPLSSKLVNWPIHLLLGQLR